MDGKFFQDLPFHYRGHFLRVNCIINNTRLLLLSLRKAL